MYPDKNLSQHLKRRLPMDKRNFETSGKPIRICPGENGRIAVYLPYTPKRLEKIKTISGRKWDPDIKCWILPHSNSIVQKLFSLFKGEQIEVHPSLHSSKTPPEEPEPYHTKSLLAMAQELRLRGYRAKSRKSYLGHAERFVRFYGKDPQSLGKKEVRQLCVRHA